MKFPKILTLLILLTVLLAACGSPEEPAPAPAVEGVEAEPAESEENAEAVTLHIVGPWQASELDAFNEVLDGFTENTGIKVQYEGTSDVLGPITTRLAAGSPPDLAILPVAQGLKDLTAQGALIPLNEMKDEISANFTQGWIDQFTIDGNLYAIPTRSNVQTLLWFNPEALGQEPPSSWSEFTAICDELAAGGQACTAGIGKDTWTLNVLFESIYVSTYGPEQWIALFAGEIPWTDDSVVETLKRMTTFYGDKYTAGGAVGALGTGLVDGIARVYGENADASFVNAGSWANGIVSGAINENVVEGETIDYVPFPGEAAGEGVVVASADVAVMLVDSPEAKQLMSYLISSEGQGRFAPNGYTVANKNVDPAEYSGLAAKTADYLANSEITADTGSLTTNESNDQLSELLGAAILAPDTIEGLLKAFQATVDAS